MSSTGSQSVTNTFTEARARDIMAKINDDFYSITMRGFTFLDNNPKWFERYRIDILYILLHQDLKTFQVQFKHGGNENALQYIIKSDNSIQSNRDSGGVNYQNIHKDAEINIVIELHGDPKVWDELEMRGWRKNASMVTGQETNKGAYSKDGYGAAIKLIGSTWGK